MWMYNWWSIPMYTNYFSLLTLHTVTFYECEFLGEKIAMSDSLNKVIRLVHNRPLIGNYLLNSGSSVLSPMLYSFFSIKKHKQIKISQVIGGCENEICMHEDLKHLIPHIFLAGLERLIPAIKGIASPPGIDSLLLPAPSHSMIEASSNLHAWAWLGQQGEHIYNPFIQMIGFTVLEVVWSILSKENTF